MALVQPQPDKINVSPTKTALHRTRLRVLHQENFSVLFFFKPPCRAALLLASCRILRTEIVEKIFSNFQFSRSNEDRGGSSVI
ncbi:hypothetical protein [Pantoea sp. R102]|uniref:hypothetical protein n=1 Tax=Pantoea sp. R102 TaxID=2507583 RepID=UPI0010A85089|nr:hypothetical protein [Pantoea sp. R102]THD31808.1 hypothetical protein ERD80_18740 [Pantoea sp. R102]